MTETFEQFKARCDAVCVSVCGVYTDDLPDGDWYSLYEDIGDRTGPQFEEWVIELLVEIEPSIEDLL